MTLVAASDAQPLEQRIAAWLTEQNDARLNEIIGNLQQIYRQVISGEVRL